uniref:Beta C2 protein n=1 Tax=Cotton leaf curl Multan betasatellite TaxID=306025 RepID=Q8QNS3_9VIRU|nr:beta C2 protein [Cotton leaf curl Multan betasatellite]
MTTRVIRLHRHFIPLMDNHIIINHSQPHNYTKYLFIKSINACTLNNSIK